MTGWLLRVVLATWVFWWAAALFSTGPEADPVLARLGLWLGGAAPMVLAVLALFRHEGPEGRWRFLRRLVDPGMLRPSDWLRVLLPAPVITGLALMLALLTGIADPGRFAAPESWLLTPAFLLLFGPLPEEIAWRGWALDRLQRQHSALRASLLLAVVWMVWHLPLFFIDGSYQHGLGVGTAGFWLFMAALLPQTLVLTWVFNSTGGSILAAVLAHWMINLTGELSVTAVETELLALLLWSLFAMALLAVHGPARLAPRRGGPLRGQRSRSDLRSRG
ncbi:MAG: type II CAAX endopeptidase family protein [Gammaproteobacteria bacterium]|nr:type II CAAX endopeptidase family protein [Gammaproteobacteria bacterium]